MAKLTFKDRWLIWRPAILGNEAADEPFRVRVKRLSSGDLVAFRERAAEMRGRLVEGVAADEIAALFDGLLDGPHGDVVIDDVPATSMRPLYEAAAQDFPLVGCVFDGLASSVTLANELNEEQEKNFERRRGGSGGTQAATTAASPPPSDARAAESSASEASIS